MASKVEKLNPLAQKAQERDERVRERLTCDTPFRDSPESNISDLAKAAYPDKPGEQARYAEKITASLTAHLQENQDILKLWAFLKEKGCRTSAIVDGYLRFFAGQKGENEIQIEQFMKPFRIETASNLHKTKTEVQKEILGSTRTQLASFLDELRAENIDLPKQTTV